MYIPKHFEQSNIEAMHELMDENSFATLVTLNAEGLCCNHIPFELKKTSGPYGTLLGHVSRANSVWQTSDGNEAIVIFHGADAYITPSWYSSKEETGKVVPTWNYAVVHAHGIVRSVVDKKWLRAHVETLTHHQESTFPISWSVSDAPEAFIGKMLDGIVGLEIPISKLSGKWKASQNRHESDKAGVAKGLRSLGKVQIAELVERGTG